MDRMKVIDRVRKLLALAESPVEAEAQAALAKAQSLMMVNAIEEWEVGQKAGTQIHYVEKVIAKLHAITLRHQQIAGLLHRHFNVRIVYTSYKGGAMIRAFGKEEDIENAEFVRNFLLETYHRLYFGYLRRTRQKRRAEHANAYYTGITTGFERALNDNKRADANVGKALMVIGKELTEAYDKQFPDLKPKTSKHQVNPLHEAFSEGYREGQKISIAKAIEKN